MKTIGRTAVFSLAAFAALAMFALTYAQGPADDPFGQAPKSAPSATPGAKKTAKPPASQAFLDTLPRPKRPAPGKPASSDPNRKHVEVSTYPKDKPVLIVEYPWKAHSKASVEVRLLREDDPATPEWEDDPDTSEVRPLAFVGRIMKGEVMLAAFRAQDLDMETTVTKTFHYKDRDYEIDYSIVAEKNHLGNSAGKIIFPGKPETAEPMPRVIYYPLEPWAADRDTLRLELPPEHFAKPGRVRVWFFRDDNILWWQTVAWPGLPGVAVKESTPPEAAAKKPTGGTP